MDAAALATFLLDHGVTAKDADAAIPPPAKRKLALKEAGREERGDGREEHGARDRVVEGHSLPKAALRRCETAPLHAPPEL